MSARFAIAEAMSESGISIVLSILLSSNVFGGYYRHEPVCFLEQPREAELFFALGVTEFGVLSGRLALCVV